MEAVLTLINSRDLDGAIVLMSKIELEAEENSLEVLEVQGLNALFYAMFLACYLARNDLSNAKYLWKRSPENHKAGAGGLAYCQMWEVGKAMRKDDIAGAVLNVLSAQWPAELQSIATLLSDSLIEGYITAATVAYTQISIGQVANQLRLPEPKLLEWLMRLGCKVDGTTGVITAGPTRQGLVSGEPVDTQISESALLLKRATEVAAHMEQPSIKTESRK